MRKGSVTFGTKLLNEICSCYVVNWNLVIVSARDIETAATNRSPFLHVHWDQMLFRRAEARVGEPDKVRRLWPWVPRDAVLQGKHTVLHGSLSTQYRGVRNKSRVSLFRRRGNSLDPPARLGWKRKPIIYNGSNGYLSPLPTSINDLFHLDITIACPSP